MAEYTYAGNLLPGEKTERLILRGGALVVNLGQWADLTSQEYAQLSTRYNLVPGRSGTAAGPNAPGLYDFLSPLAVAQMVTQILTSGSLVGIPPADSSVVTSNSTLTANKRTLVDASAGSVTMTLPDPASVPKSSSIAVGKAPNDTTGNAVIVSGLIDGTSTTHNLTLPREVRIYTIDTSGSWTVVADHKTLASLRSLWQAADQVVLDAIPGVVAATPTVSTAAAAAVQNVANNLQLVTAPQTDSTTIMFSIVDLNGRRSVLEVGMDGKWTPESAAITAAQIASAVGTAIGNEATGAAAGSGVMWAVVDSSGRLSWLQVGLDGRPTQSSIDMLATALQSNINAVATSSAQSATGIDSTSLAPATDVWFAVTDSLGRRSVIEIDGTGMFTQRALDLIAAKIGVGVNTVGLSNLKPEVSSLLRRSPTAYYTEVVGTNLYVLERSTGSRRLITSGGGALSGVRLTEDDYVLWTDSNGSWARKVDASTAKVQQSTDQAIVLWGDSYTQANAGPWDAKVAAVTGLPVTNAGLSGITSTDIAIRQGGVEPVFTVPSGSLPAGTTAEPLTLVSPTSSYRNTVGSYSFSGTLAGVTGTLTQSLNAWTFTRTTAGSSVPISGQVKFHGTAGDAHVTKIPVIFTGRNNWFNPGTFMSDVRRDDQSMVDHIAAYAKRYVVIGPMNSPNEVNGSSAYNSILAENQALASIFGGMYFNLRSYFIANANAWMLANGITPTAQDAIDIANDCPPRSLYGGDVFHPNATGYQLFGQGVGDFIVSKGWTV